LFLFSFFFFFLRSPDGAQRNPGTAVKIAMPLPDFAALHPGYKSAPSLIEPKPVLPPGLEQNFGVTRSKTLGVFPCRAANLGCKKPHRENAEARPVHLILRRERSEPRRM
jgi:hypothetical protein